MASPVTVQKFGANNKMTMKEFDPGDTTAADIEWVDMRDYGTFTAMLFNSVGTGSIQTFAILANAESDGSGTDVNIATHALTSQPDAVGDFIVLEINQQQINQEGEDNSVPNLRYVSVSCRLGVATDEKVFTYVRSDTKRPQQDLTVGVVA